MISGCRLGMGTYEAVDAKFVFGGGRGEGERMTDTVSESVDTATEALFDSSLTASLFASRVPDLGGRLPSVTPEADLAKDGLGLRLLNFSRNVVDVRSLRCVV